MGTGGFSVRAVGERLSTPALRSPRMSRPWLLSLRSESRIYCGRFLPTGESQFLTGTILRLGNWAMPAMARRMGGEPGGSRNEGWFHSVPSTQLKCKSLGAGEFSIRICLTPCSARVRRGKRFKAFIKEKGWSVSSCPLLYIMMCGWPARAERSTIFQLRFWLDTISSYSESRIATFRPHP